MGPDTISRIQKQIAYLYEQVKCLSKNVTFSDTDLNFDNGSKTLTSTFADGSTQTTLIPIPTSTSELTNNGNGTSPFITILDVPEVGTYTIDLVAQELKLYRNLVEVDSVDLSSLITEKSCAEIVACIDEELGNTDWKTQKSDADICLLMRAALVTGPHSGISVTYDEETCSFGLAVNGETFSPELLAKLEGIAVGAQVNSVLSVQGAIGHISLTASDIPVDTTNFSNNLSPLDDDLQKALDTLDNLAAVVGGTTHGSLAGLGNDDHTQYHNDARGDIRYYTKAEVDAHTSDDTIHFTQAEINITESQISDLKNYLLPTDIDTLVKLNTILSDATLIDTTDSRLSDARTPLAHTHTASEITDFDTEVANNSAVVLNTAKIGLSNSGVTPGTYNFATIVVDANGIITAASSGTPGGGGATQLDQLTDVSLATPTDKHALLGNGTTFASRALVLADISDYSDPSLSNSDQVIGVNNRVITYANTGGSLLIRNSTVTNTWSFSGADVIAESLSGTFQARYDTIKLGIEGIGYDFESTPSIIKIGAGGSKPFIVDTNGYAQIYGSSRVFQLFTDGFTFRNKTSSDPLPTLNFLSGFDDDEKRHFVFQSGSTSDDFTYTFPNKSGVVAMLSDISGGGGATQLSDLSDVGTVTPTDKHVIIGDGSEFTSRALNLADISDYSDTSLSAINQSITSDRVVEMGLGNSLRFEYAISNLRFVEFNENATTIDYGSTFGSLLFRAEDISIGAVDEIHIGEFSVELGNNTSKFVTLRSSQQSTVSSNLKYIAVNADGFSFGEQQSLDPIPNFKFQSGSGAGAIRNLTFEDAAVSGTYNYVMPAKSGTFAMLSDIVGGGGSTIDGHVIYDDSTPLAQRAKLRLLGSAISLVDNSGNDSTDLTIDKKNTG